jgi:hypothetical protein
LPLFFARTGESKGGMDGYLGPLWYAGEIVRKIIQNGLRKLILGAICTLNHIRFVEAANMNRH